MNELDERIRAALDAQAATIDVLPRRRSADGDDGPEADVIEFAPRRWSAPMLVAATVAVIVAGAAIGFGVERGGGHHPGAGTSPSSPVSTSAPSSNPAPVSSPPASTSSSPSTSPTVTSTAGTPIVFGATEVGIWPFATTLQVSQWQAAYGSAGTDPWHLDPDATAVMFAANYLGFTDITTVTSHTGSGRNLAIGVGYEGPNNPTAAVVHLVQLGAASDSGWEVVGATSPSISITGPQSGSTIAPSSPLKVTGRITGVDESIRVSVRQVGTDPVGQDCCQAAGGDNQPWTALVDLQLPPIPAPVNLPALAPGVVAIVASTGGHVQAVERFAVVGVIAR